MAKQSTVPAQIASSITGTGGNALIYVGGGMEGVGRSTVSGAVIDYLNGLGKSVVLIDCGSNCADVFKACGKAVYHAEP